jgi:ketosteroid isomerase-like protein
MMKNFPLMMALLLLCPIAGAANEAPPKQVIATVTRTIQLFSTLENNWLDAVQKRDTEALRTLVADEFEMRVSTAPGNPTPREEFLKRLLATPTFNSHIEQMAAHEYGELVLVSFLWKIDAPKNSPLPQQVFVVDTWKQVQGNWQLVVRYAASSGTKPPPGADVSAPSIKKKI